MPRTTSLIWDGVFDATVAALASSSLVPRVPDPPRRRSEEAFLPALWRVRFSYLTFDPAVWPLALYQRLSEATKSHSLS
jgi:hypothetical protein